MTDTVKTVFHRGPKSAPKSAFWGGIKDGLASVIFPATAHRLHFQIGSLDVDHRRILMMRAMLSERRRELEAERLRDAALHSRKKADLIDSARS